MSFFAPKIRLNGSGPYAVRGPWWLHRIWLVKKLRTAEAFGYDLRTVTGVLKSHAISWYLRRPSEDEITAAFKSNLRDIDTFVRLGYHRGDPIQRSKLFSAVARTHLLFDDYGARQEHIEEGIAFCLEHPALPVQLGFVLAQMLAYHRPRRQLTSYEYLQFRKRCAGLTDPEAVRLSILLTDVLRADLEVQKEAA